MRTKPFKSLTYRLIYQLIETKFKLLSERIERTDFCWECVNISIYNPYQKRIAWGFMEREKGNYTFSVFFKDDARTERQVILDNDILNFFAKSTELAMKFATTKRKNYGKEKLKDFIE